LSKTLAPVTEKARSTRVFKNAVSATASEDIIKPSKSLETTATQTTKTMKVRKLPTSAGTAAAAEKSPLDRTLIFYRWCLRRL